MVGLTRTDKDRQGQTRTSTVQYGVPSKSPVLCRGLRTGRVQTSLVLCRATVHNASERPSALCQAALRNQPRTTVDPDRGADHCLQASSLAVASNIARVHKNRYQVHSVRGGIHPLSPHCPHSVPSSGHPHTLHAWCSSSLACTSTPYLDASKPETTSSSSATSLAHDRGLSPHCLQGFRSETECCIAAWGCLARCQTCLVCCHQANQSC